MTLKDAIYDLANRFAEQPFQWGTFDCVQFICAYCELRTGWSPAYEKQWQYHDQLGAERLIARHGSLLGLMTRIFGDPHPEPIEGDIVLSLLGKIDGGSVEAMGIYNGHFVLGVLPERPGIARYSRVHIAQAWTLCRLPPQHP